MHEILLRLLLPCAISLKDVGNMYVCLFYISLKFWVYSVVLVGIQLTIVFRLKLKVRVGKSIFPDSVPSKDAHIHSGRRSFPLLVSKLCHESQHPEACRMLL